DLTTGYNDTAVPANQTAAQVPVPTFLCPTNPLRPSTGRDSQLYGYCDYMPVAYVDINTAYAPANFIRVTSVPNRVQGALRANGVVGTVGNANNIVSRPTSSVPGDITDGLSRTIAMTEDVGRGEAYNTPKYCDPYQSGLVTATPNATNGCVAAGKAR